MARKILGYAKAGLPMIVVCRAPGAVPGLDARADRDLQPAAQPAAPGPVVSVHRPDPDDTDFYWLYI
ncbi:hypothetical protein [Streptomyces sp. NPDC096142]|uniref:hypothetical protein n=1 Tax=Streptomyces sp. NPDC096142 TaxID=3366077 RepID=UPI0038226E23